MKTKEITPIQYADAIDRSLQQITKALRDGKELDNVIEIRHYSRFYILVVPESFRVNSIKQARINQDEKYGQWKQNISETAKPIP